MGWASLSAIIDEARRLAAADAAGPRLDCPLCLTLLQPAPRGGLFCPFDGWRSGQ